MELFPRLSSLFDFSFLPKEVEFVADGVTAATSDLYYQNYTAWRGQGLGSAGFNVNVISRKLIRLQVPGTDFALSLNQQDIDGAGVTVIPVAGSYRWAILRYVPELDLTALPNWGAPELLDLFEQLTQADTTTQLLALVLAFVAPDLGEETTVLPKLENFATTLRAQYGASLALAQPLAAQNDSDALQELGTALTTAGLSVTQVLLDLYILPAGTVAAALAVLDKYFLAATGIDFRAYLLDLLVPEVSVATELAAALEVPRALFQPLYLDTATQKWKVQPAPAKAKLTFAKGQFTFSTRGGFGYATELAVSFPPDQKRVQLGDTGLQLEFGKAKLDLSTRTNIAEADADGRGLDFQGIYISQADVFLPDGWTIQAGRIGVKNVLLGTGGLSGTFAVQGTTLLQARLLGSLTVNFASFDVTFRQSAVVSSAIKGTFTLDSFRGPDGKLAPFAFELSYAADGYALTFNAPVVKGKAVPVTVQLGALGSVHFTKLAFTKKGADWALDLVADIEPGHTLPVIGRALPSHIVVSKLHVGTDGVDFVAKPTWDDGTQLALDPQHPTLDVALNKTILNILRVEHLRFGLTQAGNTRSLSATFDAELGLTPDSVSAPVGKTGTPPPGVHARITKAGFTATVLPTPGGGGNLGLATVGLGIKLPDSASLTVNVGGLVGSGSLAILDNGTRYEGVLDLTFNKTLHLAAYGILQQNLPGGGEGPSLLALITAQFDPIELGLGFTLNAVGGLLGLHRAADTQHLLGMVRQGELKKLLFPTPKDPDHRQLSDLTDTLAVIDAAFPATPGRYLIGLMAQLGWGTRTLITLDVALLVELPSPVRLAVLGVLQAVLPGPPDQDDLLKLRADFLGTIDFGAKKVAFDASLVQSHILKYTLTGDLAFRLYQGDNPLFVITAGGFHPSFQPPAGANLTSLKRLTLNLSQSSDLQLTLASYFAVTSNTVQFGAHLDLLYRIGHGFRVEGHFGFDVLFQFSPFRVLAHVEAGVAIKAGSAELLSLHLALDVAGPGPWHIWGEASFRIWFVKISVDVNATLGERSPETTAPQLAPDVATPLRAALREAASWEVEAPATAALPGGVVLRPADTKAGQFFLDPRGALVVRQHVAPLGLKLEKYGASAVAPTGGNYFRLVGVLLNGEEYPGTDHAGATQPVSDFFVPEQFRVLTDAQKLSLPSFQLLPSGLRLKSLASLTAREQSALRVVEYEKKVIGGQSGGSTAGAAKLKIDPTAFQKLAQGGALGQAVQAAQPSARAPRPLGWQEDTYEVVRASDLAFYSAELANQGFQSQVLAEQYCRQVVADHPALAGELLVLPTHERALA